MNASKPMPIPSGAMCMLVDIDQAGLPIESDRVYLVARTRDGELYEWSLRRAYVTPDRIEFRTESSTDYQPIVTANPPDPTHVKIVGLLYGMQVRL